MTYFKILDEVEREFCPDCGSHTLYKISYSVDSSGNVRYHEPRNRKVNLRGKIVRSTQFPIPNPKGGKQSSDMILREDQMLLMNGRQHAWKSKQIKEDPLDLDAVEKFGLNLKKKQQHKFGHNRRNPNEAVKRTSHKRQIISKVNRL